MSRRCRGDSGQATTEVVLLMPVLLFLVMLVIQFGLWYHAQHVVQAAAQEGVRAARVEGGTAGAGQQRAEAFLDSAGSTLVRDAGVTATRDGETATVRVTGRVAGVVPGFSLPLDASAESPVERFRSAAEEAAP
ncbi:MAG: pilus assembly protein [Actinobacteria bacterium]|nr:pilus assembly protein [Actinomycetota bacterium]